jgi:hypothetical protein
MSSPPDTPPSGTCTRRRLLVGLGTRGTGAGRSELDGADLARQFAVDNGVPDGRADIIWDAVTLHTSPDIAERKRPEIGLVSLGAGFDLGGSSGRGDY